MTAKQVPLEILQAASNVLADQLQTLEHLGVNWEEEDFKEFLRQCRDLRDWLNANGVPVAEYECSQHKRLFEEHLQ